MSIKEGIYQPVPFDKVQINDAFWAPRLLANRQIGLFSVYEQLKKTGRLHAYQLDWTPERNDPKPHVFWDSDVAKWLEGACYSLVTHPDEELLSRVEAVVDLILTAQGDDGYLNPYFTVVESEGRWKNLRDRHELYCAGHLIEAAVAHHQATGDPRFLVAMKKYADLIVEVFGIKEGQIPGYPGHEEIELALVKLYRHTGKRRYLDLARHFIEQRGQPPHIFDIEAHLRGEDPADYWAKNHTYTQSHCPVRKQTEVVGHAVRAMYFFSGVTDLAAVLGDAELLVTLQTLWDDLTIHKMYLTGGIGSANANEGFTSPFDLPNEDAYAETCAAIGLIFWAQRMLKIDLDSRYADVMERALYNGMLSGVSLSGDHFFYTNPMASDGRHQRQRFFTCACCPPNITRLLPALGKYLYTTLNNEIAVHLYIQSQATVNLDDGVVTLIQETDYPWDGIVCLRFDMETPVEFTLKLRKPGWCRESRLYLDGENQPIEKRLDRGYYVIKRVWQPGEVLRMQWLMPVTCVYAHPNIRADIGRVAFMRGPLVYCLEDVDHPVPVHHLCIPRKVSFDCQFEPELLGGIMTLHGTAGAVDVREWEQTLYRETPARLKNVSFKAVPYYAWGNRAPGQMQVWLPELV